MGMLLMLLSACMNPESLVENNRNSGDGKILETFSDNEIIKLADLDIQLKEIEQAEEEGEVVISLTVTVKNQSLDNGTTIDQSLFSISAEQNNKMLVAESVEPFVLDEEREISYKFHLLSESDVVLFTFDYNNNNNQQMTKHYDVYLE